jgi:ATP-binding cassette, subfamily B, bacterial MsbA
LLQDRAISEAEAKAREKYRRDKKNNAHFFRAVKYLYPYRTLVGVSVVAAIFVGMAMAGGLTPILPIVRVLLEHDTVPAWVDRNIVDRRLDIQLNEVPTLPNLQIVGMGDRSPIRDVGYQNGDLLIGNLPPTPLLHVLADPANTTAVFHVAGQPDRTLPLKPVRLQWLLLRRAAGWLPGNPVKAIAVIFGVLAAMALIGNVFRFFQEYLSSKAAILAVNDIRTRLYDHVLRVPMGYFSEQGTSDATSRLVQDCSNLTDGFKQIIGQTIQEPIKVLTGLCVALVASWQITLFILLFAPLMGLSVRKFGKKMYRASRKQLQESASMLGQLESTLIGIRVVKASGAERAERRRYGRIMDALVKQQLRMSRIDAFNSPTMEMILLAAGGCVVIYGAYLVLSVQKLDPGEFIVAMAALASITESLRRISKVSTALQQSNAAAARIFEIMDLAVEQDRNRDNGNVKLRGLKSEIRMEGVSFSYPGSQALALDDVSLTAPRGRCFAIVGRNGSGKTTLMNLLPRFYDPQRGRILIDGQDIRNATLRSLRRQVSIVTQDSVIFPGTIAENIAYGHSLSARLAQNSPAIVDLRQQIETAARQAFAHDFIMEKPDGYDCRLGELGGQLSGGQKQRICIARAILRNAPILILDEATSQVDAESEQLIQQAIESLIHEHRRTTFVIAHRLSTIRGADEIIVMEQGRICGQGSHDDLMRTCPTYQQLYERQLYAAPVS